MPTAKIFWLFGGDEISIDIKGFRYQRQWRDPCGGPRGPTLSEILTSFGLHPKAQGAHLRRLSGAYDPGDYHYTAQVPETLLPALEQWWETAQRHDWPDEPHARKEALQNIPYQ